MDYTSDEGEWEDFRRQLRAHGGREFRRFGLRDRGARLAAAVRTLPHRLCKSTLSCVAAMHRWWPLRANKRHGRSAYAAAIVNPRVIQAIGSRALGKIAINLVEWSGVRQ